MRPPWGRDMLLAIIFLASVIAAVVLLVRSPVPVVARLGLGITLLAFLVLAYFFAAKSKISPFGTSSTIDFGFWDQSLQIGIATIGAIAGVIGSYFFRIGQEPITWRSFVRPLSTCPIVLIPTLKLVESSGEQTLMTVAVLFALSYQNGFFWERLLKPSKE
jgi:hypothetical protein